MPRNASTNHRRLALVVAIIAGLLLTLAAPAFAHTGFVSSTPSDGATINEPVSEISLTFSGAASPAGEGFLVLDTDGEIRIPDEITSADDLTWTLRFDDPLTSGAIGVRWSVSAPDAHPIDGSFSFIITETAPEPTTTTPTPSEAEPAESQPSFAEAPEDVPEGGRAGQSETTPSEAQPEELQTGGIDADEALTLDDFLNTPHNTAVGASLVAGTSRVVGLLGAIGAIGGTLFAAFVLRGDPRDIRAVLFWVRRAGAIIIIGAIAQTAAQIATVAQGWAGLWSTSTIGDVLWSSFGLAATLRLLGGSALSFGAQLDTHAASLAPDPVASIKQLTTVGASQTGSDTGWASTNGADADALVHDGDHAWQVSKNPAAFAGVGLLALSFLFDGHTVSEGPRWLHAIANLVHVMTAATWGGGVVMLALVMARRHRRGADTRALQLGIRFSVVAIAALVAAAVAGTVLTIVILDSVAEIWTTPWGRLLILKVALVAAAAAGGGYNHRVLIPKLEQNPDSPKLAGRFRTIVTIEAVALIAVTVTTALLIGASSA